MKFSLGRASWRTQLSVAYASMAVIPLLTFGYFLTSYLIPGAATRENLLMVVFFVMLLSLAGFCIVARVVRTLSCVRGYLGAIAGGGFEKREFACEGPEAESLLRSLGVIVEKLKSDQARLELSSRSQEKDVAHRIDELCRDIEERKKTEQALRESNMMLSDALTGLKEMQHRLLHEERMSALGQMASSIAHDFNNALMPIVGLTEFLLMNREKLKDTDELVSTLEDIHTSADKAKDAVVRLREFYKSDDDLDIGAVDVNAVFEKAVAACGSSLQKGAGKPDGKGVTVSRVFTDVPLVNADEGELREALRNIILNAIEAMPTGGVITCRSSFEGKWVMMEIADTGVGMTPDVQARCMEPFFSTKGAHGAGIGLSVVYGIMRRHKGNLEITSEPGRGTRVKLMLPVIRVPESGLPGGPSGSGSSGPLKILLVDDDVSARKIVSKYLTIVGHTVETAESGSEGLDKFKNGLYDLVVTDRAMPDMSGDVVALTIKRSGRQVPVIMLTGFGDIMKDKNEIPEGVLMILGKPVSLKELKNAVSEAVSRK